MVKVEIYKKWISIFLLLLLCSGGLPIQIVHAQPVPETPKDTNTEINNLRERVTKLEAERLYKVLRPTKDIEFLFDMVVNNEKYVFTNKNSDCCKNYSPGGKSNLDERCTNIRSRIWSSLKFKKPTDTSYECISDVCKLEAVEEVLGINPNQTPSDPTQSAEKKTIKLRIKRAYEEINYPEWDSDSIRFGVMLGYIPGIEATTTSISLHAYPSYQRNIPGRLDLVRRSSFYFAVGGVSTADQTNEVTGAAYSVGLGVEITRGVIFTYGTTLYRSGNNTS